MNNRLKGFFAVCAGIALILSSGCGHKAGTGNKVELRFSTPFFTAGYQAMYRGLIAKFEKAHPDIKVKLEAEVGSPEVKFQTQVAGNAAPDVIISAGKNLADYGSRGVLLDLREYVKKDNYDLPDFYPLDFAEGAVPSGALYGMPQGGGPEVLYYNKDLFDKAGLKYPDDSWTWQDALKAAQKLTVDLNGDGRTDQFGISCPLQGWMATLPFVWDFGGDLLNSSKTRCIIHSPAAAEAIQFLIDLRHKYKVAPDAASDATFGQWDALFAAGRIGMVCYHAEGLPARCAEVKSLHWDIAPRPKGKKGRIPRFTGLVVSIWSGSQHKDAAWELVKFLTGQEVMREIARGNFNMPARKSVAESPDFIKENTPFHEEVFVQSMKYARTLPNLPRLGNAGEINQIWDNQMDQAEMGKKTVDAALKTVEDGINKILSARK